MLDMAEDGQVQSLEADVHSLFVQEMETLFDCVVGTWSPCRLDSVDDKRPFLVADTTALVRELEGTAVVCNTMDW